MRLRSRRRTVIIAAGAVALLGSLYAWRQVPCKALKAVGAINAYCHEEFGNQYYPPTGPTIIAVVLSETDWAVRLARGTPGHETAVKYARYNARTCAVSPYPELYVPAEGPFSATARAAVLDPWGTREPLTAEEAEERAKNLADVGPPEFVRNDINAFNEDIGEIWPSSVLWQYAVKTGWIKQSEGVMIIMVGLGGYGDSHHAWTFYLVCAWGEVPSAGMGGPYGAGEIDLRTLKITPGIGEG